LRRSDGGKGGGVGASSSSGKGGSGGKLRGALGRGGQEAGAFRLHATSLKIRDDATVANFVDLKANLVGLSFEPRH